MKPTLPFLTFLLLAPLAALHTANLPPLDTCGGIPAIKREATGFFRVEQINGRWMFISPEGHGYLALGANHIGKHMAGQAAELLKRFEGDREKAGAALTQAIRDLEMSPFS